MNKIKNKIFNNFLQTIFYIFIFFISSKIFIFGDYPLIFGFFIFILFYIKNISIIYSVFYFLLQIYIFQNNILYLPNLIFLSIQFLSCLIIVILKNIKKQYFYKKTIFLFLSIIIISQILIQLVNNFSILQLFVFFCYYVTFFILLVLCSKTYNSNLIFSIEEYFFLICLIFLFLNGLVFDLFFWILVFSTITILLLLKKFYLQYFIFFIVCIMGSLFYSNLYSLNFFTTLTIFKLYKIISCIIGLTIGLFIYKYLNLTNKNIKHIIFDLYVKQINYENEKIKNNKLLSLKQLLYKINNNDMILDNYINKIITKNVYNIDSFEKIKKTYKNYFNFKINRIYIKQVFYNDMYYFLLLQKIDNFKINKIEHTITKLYKIQYKIVSIDNYSIKNITIVILKKESSFKNEIDINFLSKAKNKDGINGDVCEHFYTDKNIIAILSDGMGHGKKAKEISSLVVDFIKYSFICGFEDVYNIIDTINNVIDNKKIESFACVDILIINKFDYSTVLYKIGSPNTFVFINKEDNIFKKNYDKKIIQNINPPIGVFKDIIKDKIDINFCNGSTIVMCTDGIINCYTDTEFEELISDNIESSALDISNKIMEKTLSIKNKNEDDKTVLVIKRN